MDKNTHEGKKQHEVYLSLGSNLGNRKENIASALDYIAALGAIKSVSHIYESEPWHMNSLNVFYNLCICLTTHLEPLSLLQRLKTIESDLGRVNNSTCSEYQDRTIDIDILYYDTVILDDEELQIPHPHIEKRTFVLKPMQDIAPDFVHPTLNLTQQQLLHACADESTLTRI